MAIREEDQQTTPNSPKNIFDKDYREQTNGNQPDPSAKRNVGLNGDTERSGQMDKLENMHIGGNEVSGYGANDPNSIESIAQGPGFEFEGSYEEGETGDVSGIRNGDQPFGSSEKEPSDNQQEKDRI